MKLWTRLFGQEPDVPHITRVVMGPDDVIVAHVDFTLHPKTAEVISKELKKTFGEKRRIVVLGPEIRLEVCSPSAEGGAS